MTRWMGGRTARQIAAIVVIAMLAAHAVTAVIWSAFDMRPGPPPDYLAPASRIGLVLWLLRTLPAEDDAAILAAASRGAVTVRQGDGEPPVLGSGEDHELLGWRQAIEAELGPDARGWTVGRAARPDGTPGDLTLGVRRGDGWLLFDVAPKTGRREKALHWISPSGLAWFIASPLLIGVVSLWATRRVVSPLTRLAAATAGLGDLKEPTPVPEEGAVEVRQVAHAFNTVTGRLRRFVVERTRMLAAVSHDLRTPLTRMRLRAETVEDEETRTKMLTDIRTMESMITATLAFIREESAQEPVERVDMAVLVQTVCDDFADAGADVRYEGPLHCAASCRPQAMQRALNNLIDNAVKLDAGVTARLEAAADGFVVTIDDDGPGIPDDQKQAVFRPFFSGEARRDESNGNVGLGLSIVRAIVLSHDGRIELSDREPSGLSVRVSIPWKQRKSEATTESAAASRAGVGR